MRFLTYITCSVINLCLLTHANNSVAASKLQHKTSHSVVKLHGKKAARNKVVPIDVWDRVRAGMRLPQPTAVILPQVEEKPEVSANSTDSHASSKLADASKSSIPEQPTATKQSQAHKDADEFSEFENTNSEALEAKYAQATLAQQQPIHEKSSDSCIKKVAVSSDSSSKTVVKRVHTRIEFNSGLQDHRVKSRIQERIVTDDSYALNKEELEITSDAPCLQNTKTVPAELQNASDSTAATTTPKLSNEEIDQLAKQAANYARVNNFVQRYSQQVEYVRQVAERARPYLFHIVENLKKYNLPTELALLPIVESSYQPTALSPKSAAGLWQFIPSTGEEYNLKQTEFYDERMDIAASTTAAMRYLSFLRQYYNGDWLLAIAAYNCGPGRIDDAIAQNKANNLPTDYWSLNLPDETEDYVPRLLALATLFNNPSAYNLKLNYLRNEPYFVQVKIEREFDVKNLTNKSVQAVAELANISLEHFNILNPGYINAKLSDASSYTFLLPGSNAAQLRQRLDLLANLNTQIAKIPSSIATQTHALSTPDWQNPSLPFLTLDIDRTALPSEKTKLTAITQALTPSVSTPAKPALAVASARQPVNPGLVSSPKHSPQAQKNPAIAIAATEASTKIHRLDKGETLASVAKQYQISIDELMSVNRLNRNPNLVRGQQLKIPGKRKRVV